VPAKIRRPTLPTSASAFVIKNAQDRVAGSERLVRSPSPAMSRLKFCGCGKLG
jgi:hypothetical protein